MGSPIDNGDFGLGAAAISVYRLVKLNAGVVEVSAAATDACFGFLQSGVEANAEKALVSIDGRSFGVASGVIAAGDLLEAGADGKIAVHSGASTNPIVGRALEAATADGDYIELLIGPGTIAGPAA